MTIRKLERKLYKKHGGSKYFIDCNTSAADSITITDTIRNKYDISILQAILTNGVKTNIVVKLGPENKTIRREYNISNALFRAEIPGFIKFTCIFTCYDDTHKKEKATKICVGKEIDENSRDVLLMPFFSEGSIKTHFWNMQNFHILKSVIMQAISSVFLAYHRIGFLHNDLHFDNILLKRTSKPILFYSNELQIPTNGYSIAIMDFDSSMLIPFENRASGNTFYWSNLYNMISRINSDLTNKNGDKVNMIMNSEIIRYIDDQKNNNGDYMNTHYLLQLLDKTNFELIKKPSYIYDPNIFG